MRSGVYAKRSSFRQFWTPSSVRAALRSSPSRVSTLRRWTAAASLVGCAPQQCGECWNGWMWLWVKGGRPTNARTPH